MILAIDPGLKCGYAINTKPITSGVLDLKGNRFEGAGMRYIRLNKFLAETTDAHDIKMIVYEEVHRHMGTAAAHSYGAMIGHIQCFCEGKKIPCSGVPVGNIKTQACGKGRASKEDMVRLCKEKLGIEPKDDNEADAVWMLKYAEDTFETEGGGA